MRSADDGDEYGDCGGDGNGAVKYKLEECQEFGGVACIMWLSRSAALPIT
jgi:hypothetical protein